ncbi:TetR/AcrR family transcriptional regulator [Companilactobacillus huachuanensis]|uniref:TetR/AcrR family transcriptional regulator n=1 Tax=Companilactobacillus huachuanensis TaxID=2559914 RepID=A0ABW1RPA7_9LACO|nr:TetR/AcrR family transcriptional regulator [Companilactobacillus huachuanensis]
MTSKILSKERIIKTAMNLINHQEQLNFTKLSKILGTRAQALYNYFPDITAIKVAVAAQFYKDLEVRLRADLLGLTDEQAVKIFSNVAVQYSLGKFYLVQQIISIPPDRLHDAEFEQSFRSLQLILIGLLKPIVKIESEQLVISRMIFNLIIGEILCAGYGRFDNALINTRDSFNQMLEKILSDQNK